MTKVDWLSKYIRPFRSVIPNNLLMKNIRYKHIETTLSQHYKLPYDYTNDCKLIDFDDILKKDIFLFEDRIYTFTNDICQMIRNYQEYYLSPFLENDFFRIIMRYPYSEKLNYKLYYYLQKEQSDYFNRISTDNIGDTLPQTWFMYKVKRYPGPLGFLKRKFFSQDYCIYSSFYNTEFMKQLKGSKEINNLYNEYPSLAKTDRTILHYFIINRYISQSKKLLSTLC